MKDKLWKELEDDFYMPSFKRIKEFVEEIGIRRHDKNYTTKNRMPLYAIVISKLYGFYIREKSLRGCGQDNIVSQPGAGGKGGPQNAKVKYWVVGHGADTNETGMVMYKTYIKTIWEGFPAQQGNNEEQILEDFCYERYGKRTAWVQGVAPCRNWYIREIQQKDYDNPQPINWGGHKTKTEILVLGIGDMNKINIIGSENFV